MKIWCLALAGIALLATAGRATEFHVSTNGLDTNPGRRSAPLRTIQHAAELAQPGDTITVHRGVYRERINPPRGGLSDTRRIVYRAARGERVEIKGSEIVKGWTPAGNDTWSVTLPNSFFGRFNPFADRIHGDWFDRRGREHHTGAVYLDGVWLREAAMRAEVLAPAASADPDKELWFATVDPTNTTIWAQFKGADPNALTVEVNVRQTVFYPSEAGRDFITVRGFVLRDAATPWAPPTGEQIGLIGTHWSRGWIIESNTVSHSVCSGISLGKHGDQYDNTSADTAEGYVKTIERALARGWSPERIGHHLVRGNTVSDCEQAGIVGSLGAAFSTVTDNTIHHVHVRGLFSGAEMAGIKFHAAIDTIISRNTIHHCIRGLWLDWMAQGTRVSANFFAENPGEDLFLEVNHGPFVVDNNQFYSAVNVRDMSEGGTFAHNLFTGRIASRPEPSRETPYHPAHSTRVAGLARIAGGDHRFLNNLFLGPAARPENTMRPAKDPEWGGGYGLWAYDFRQFPIQTGGNLFYNGALPYKGEEGGLVVDRPAQPPHDPLAELLGRPGREVLAKLGLGAEVENHDCRIVTTKSLGRTRVAGLPYEAPDGSPLTLDRDFEGRKRARSHPGAGPFR